MAKQVRKEVRQKPEEQNQEQNQEQEQERQETQTPAKRRRIICISLMVFLGLAGIARADILNPLPGQKNQMFLASVNSANTANLLDDVTAIVNYLGVKEGYAYNFEQRKWVVTTGATIITYAPWGLSLDVQMLADDGFAGSVAWNLGSYLPTQNVPLMNLTQYLYVYGGAGAEELGSDNDALKFCALAGVEAKFSF